MSEPMSDLWECPRCHTRCIPDDGGELCPVCHREGVSVCFVDGYKKYESKPMSDARTDLSALVHRVFGAGLSDSDSAKLLACLDCGMCVTPEIVLKLLDEIAVLRARVAELEQAVKDEREACAK